MRTNIKLAASLAITTAFLFFEQSCKKETKTDAVANSEFIADSNTFADYMNWPVQATKNGMDPSLGMAHAGNDSSATRSVHFKDGVSPVNGKYPVGSIIVKHTTNSAGTLNEVTGMVKRGNGFNPTKGDWEFFILTTDGKIAKDLGIELRGANLMGGMCGNCHVGAINKDFVFSK